MTKEQIEALEEPMRTACIEAHRRYPKEKPEQALLRREGGT